LHGPSSTPSQQADETEEAINEPYNYSLYSSLMASES
jgi:hypothetical protein